MKRLISILGLTVLALLSLQAARPIAQNTSSVYQTAKRPRALALIGDRYHSSAYIRDGLAPAFLRENIPVTFIENVDALGADSLKDFQLLVILRDGMNWPNGYEKEPVKWMTETQQQAVWDFVHNGGGFLPLHNAQGIYPSGGLYYKLFGGDYGGHPEPAVFTIRVEDKNHPVTAGVDDYEIYDEQHKVLPRPRASTPPQHCAGQQSGSSGLVARNGKGPSGLSLHGPYTRWSVTSNDPTSHPQRDALVLAGQLIAF
jgi:Trehalose utilisation